MTSISVNTGPLSGAAPRVQALGREADQRAHAVKLVLRGLDLEISARQHFDQRLRSVSAKLSTQAQSLAGQARFLAMAAARYETAEDATRERAPQDRPRASGETHIGAFGSEAGSPSITERLRRLGGGFTGVDELGEALEDLVGAVPVVGTLLAYQHVLALLQDREFRKGGLSSAGWLLETGATEMVGRMLPGLGSLVSLGKAVDHVGAAAGRTAATLFPPPKRVTQWANSDIGEYVVQTATIVVVPFGFGVFGNGILRGWLQG